MRSIDTFYHQNTIFRSTTLQNEVKYLLAVKNWRRIRLKGYFSDGHYIENLIRKYTFKNREEIKRTKALKNKLIIILNFLIEKGSVVGYMLRESIV